jgi:hypothetical protein
MTKILIVTTSHDRFEGANPHPTGVYIQDIYISKIADRDRARYFLLQLS